MVAFLDERINLLDLDPSGLSFDAAAITKLLEDIAKELGHELCSSAQ